MSQTLTARWRQEVTQDTFNVDKSLLKTVVKKNTFVINKLDIDLSYETLRHLLTKQVLIILCRVVFKMKPDWFTGVARICFRPNRFIALWDKKRWRTPASSGGSLRRLNFVSLTLSCLFNLYSTL